MLIIDWKIYIEKSIYKIYNGKYIRLNMLIHLFSHVNLALLLIPMCVSVKPWSWYCTVKSNSTGLCCDGQENSVREGRECRRLSWVVPVPTLCPCLPHSVLVSCLHSHSRRSLFGDPGDLDAQRVHFSLSPCLSQVLLLSVTFSHLARQAGMISSPWPTELLYTK